MTAVELLVGPVRPLGPAGVPSGICKQLVTGSVWLGRKGFIGDAQGDLRHHGGVEKAVHHYARDHYAHWIGAGGCSDLLSRAGAFGENLSAVGVKEGDIAVGDTFRLGAALIQVSQGRQPCWKLNVQFGTPDMAERVQASGRTGWYYRVLEEGVVAPGDALDLVDRPAPEWTISRLWRAFYEETLNMAELTAIVALSPLAASWRSHAARRIATGQVEDWSRRLYGPAA